MASVDVKSLEGLCQQAKRASIALRGMTAARKNEVLHEMADALVRRTDEIIRENELDVADAKAAHRPGAMVDRLMLDADRVMGMARGIRQVAALPDPVGEVEDGRQLPNGLQLVKKRVPLGVVAVIYEGRPNVTSDAAALCIKSGNAAILRGSSVARRSNGMIADVLTRALNEADAPAGAITNVDGDYDQLRQLIQMKHLVDLVIPRGGEELKSFLMEHATVPVIYAASGNNHVYIDSDADVQKAVKIAVNAKAQRPGVCNAAETLLVHRDVAAVALPAVVAAMAPHGVELRVCAASRQILGDAAEGLVEATELDYATEFLDLTMAVRVVESLDEAIEHITRHGSGHSEAIVTRSLAAAQEFEAGVDAACVYVNASTRFTDGGEFGMGAEIANSTQKLHARGPIGLRELTSMKYVVTGDGHVRS
jgi:glutamate-5-semialdehyde dehydrogenase